MHGIANTGKEPTSICEISQNTGRLHFSARWRSQAYYNKNESVVPYEKKPKTESQKLPFPQATGFLVIINSTTQ